MWLVIDGQCCFVFCRDRSDTSVVGSSRPVCKTNPNQHTLLLTSFSPTLFGFIHPSQEHSVNKNPIVSFVYCVFFVCFTFVLISQPLCDLMFFFKESFLHLTRFISEKSLLCVSYDISRLKLLWLIERRFGRTSFFKTMEYIFEMLLY